MNMLVRIENYTFKPLKKKGKWNKYIDAFMESGEALVVYKCSDLTELKSANAGLHKVIKERNLKDIICVRMSSKDCVIGLERVNHDD